MEKQKYKVLYNIPAVILLGIVLQISGAYLVNAFCVGIPMLGDAVPAYVLRQIEIYNSVITDLSSMEPRMITYVIFAAPMIEEIVFRVLFFLIFLKFVPFWAANLLQSILFGIYHGGLVQGSYCFLMGLVIGAVFYYTKVGMKESLIANLDAFIFGLLLHMVINAAGLYLAPLLPCDISLDMQCFIGVVGVVVMVVILAFTAKSVKKSSENNSTSCS